MRTGSLLRISAAFAVMPCSSPVSAYTQCQSAVERIWAGDGGYVWIYFPNGGSAVIGPSDPNREAVLAMATTALTASRQVIVRYAADGVNCATAGRTDFLGLYLL